MRLKIAAVLIAMTTTANAGVLVGPGATSDAFLKIPVGARAVGTGGSFTGVSGDVTALEYNPAGLLGIDRTDFSATYISYLQSTSLQSFSIGFPVQLRSTPVPAPESSGFSHNNLYMGLHYRTLHSNDTSRNSVGIEQGDFEIRDQALDLGLAYPLTSRLGLGVAGKLLNHKLENESSSNYAGDAGIFYQMTSQWSLGASLMNLGPSKAFVSDKDPLPSTARVGVTRKAENLLLLADVSTGRDKITRESLGAEYTLNRILKFRGGLINDTGLQFAGGLGVQIAGPSKASILPPAGHYKNPSNPNTPGSNQTEKNAAILADRMNKIATELTDQYKSLGINEHEPALTVIPLNSDDPKIGQMLAELLTNNFADRGEFTIIEQPDILKIIEEQKLLHLGSIDMENSIELGKKAGAEILMIGSMERLEGRYLINARLVQVVDGKILATSYEELPAQIFSKPRQTLAAVGPNQPTAAEKYSNLDIGLDYSLSTHSDLGLTHTVTLRILY